MRIFGGTELWIECISPFQYKVIVQPYQSFELPSVTRAGGKGGGTDLCSQTFLYEIQFWTTLIWSFFWFDAYFWRCSALNWRYFAISIQNNISTLSIFEPPPLWWGNRHMRSRTFLYTIQFQTTFIWSFFDSMRIFGGVKFITVYAS